MAFEAIPSPAWAASTDETPRDIETGGVPVTTVSFKLTFVHIRAAWSSLPDDIAQMAMTGKRSFCVLTVPMETEVGIHVTLIHIYTNLHVW